MDLSSPRTVLLFGLALLLVLTIISCGSQEASKSEKREGETSAQTVHQQEVTLPEHGILDERIYDVPLKTQVMLDVLVSGEISRGGLTSLLNEHYSKTQARRGFKYHNPPTHIFVYLYRSQERAQSGMGEWIAMLSKIGAGGEPQIRINEVQLIEAGVIEEERFGLTEDRRRPIWWEIQKGQSKAAKEADEKYPLSGPFSLAKYNKRRELEESLSNKYKNEIAKTYGLMPSEIDEIAWEGMAKRWLVPIASDAKEYWIRISPTLKSGYVSVRGETNLPGGSVLWADLWLYFSHEGETERRVVELDRRDDVIVTDGSFEFTMMASDGWIKSKAPRWEKKVQTIFRSAELTVTFSTVRQLADVLELVGEWGEKMNGGQVERWQSTIAQGAAITVKHPIDIPVKQ